MNNHNVMSTSLFDSSMTNYSLEDDDTSWSNINCNWDGFNFEDELTLKEDNAVNALLKVRQRSLICPKEGVCSNFKKNFNNIVSKETEVKAENYEILKLFEHLKNTRNELKEERKALSVDCRKLTDLKDTLEKEIQELASLQKLHKTGYKKALQLYEKFFDFTVRIVEISNDLIVADITFNFAKDKEPIKVVIDHIKRKIIEIHTNGLIIEENPEQVNFDSEFFCNLRQKMFETIS